MKLREYIVLPTIALAIGAFFTLSPNAESKSPRIKLEGSWVGKTDVGVRWALTYVPSDPSGQRAGFQNHMVASAEFKQAVDYLLTLLQITPPATMSAEVGETFMTGNNTAKYTGVWHGLDQEGQLTCIFVDSSAIEFSSPTEYTIKHRIGVYPASADIGNGLPAPDAQPAYCMTATSTASRVQLMPPCSAQ